MTDIELAWLAGLLEGEGCFSYSCSPGITVGMTDEDVVQRVAAFLKRKVRGPYQYKTNKKPVYYTQIWGAPAIDLMYSLLPFMGDRRTKRLLEIFEKWKLAPTKAYRLGVGQPPKCHPDRKHYAHELCGACYRRQLYYKKKGV